ncbi:MAG: Ig-like domain-containing protein, partial [Gemmatimonadetes bacterium]|nr:Ig-like domain-containing protein [Gemmatimonadota bacterium]
SYFAEPDGETLTYSATSSNTAAATVTVAGATVAVTAVAKGATNVMVTATDPGGLAATQTFEVTVPNRAPVAGDPIPSQTLKVGRAVTLDVTDYFTDPDGDELTYSVDSSRPSVATATMSGSTLTVVAVAAGTATMTVTATDPGDLSATQSTGESFDLEMAFTSSVSSTVRSHVADARDEWEAVLEDTGLDDVTIDETRSCLGISRFVGTVDDHLIFVHVDSIDGEGGILAYAGYCYRRLADDSPLLSATWIDEADVERMLDLDALVPVMFHELAHALGFSAGSARRGRRPAFRGQAGHRGLR